jgi:SSS family solute:Na+ symporter
MAVALVLLGAFALAYSFYGGLKAIALTDIVQVVLLIGGGLVTVYVLLDTLSGGAGFAAGFRQLLDAAPEKFDMILARDHPHYVSLPGLSVLLGGMWVMHLSYWGFNQYIIQRALGARSLAEAQRGLAFAAFLKILMPLIVVVPGIALFALNAQLDMPDQAYPTAMTMLPGGLKGLVFAALLAAIVSSLASMCNSISTLLTLDLLPSFRGGRPVGRPVATGRAVAVAAMIVAMLSAKPLLGSFDQAFQYIQEFTGFFTPGIVAIFLLGMFWRGTTARGALLAAAGSVTLSLLFKLLWPELPFIDRVGVVFLLAVLLAVAGSWGRASPADSMVEGIDFSTRNDFNSAALAVVLILGALYAIWW